MSRQAGNDGTTRHALLAALGPRGVASGRADVRTLGTAGTHEYHFAPHEAGTVGGVVVE